MPWSSGIGGKESGLHGAKARHGKALGAGQDLPSLLFVVPPERSRSGIEQYRDYSQIDPRPCRFGRIGARGDEGTAVKPTGREMPPAAMVRDHEIRIAPSDHTDDPADDLIEPIGDEAKIAGLSTLDRLRHDGATGAHGVGA